MWSGTSRKVNLLNFRSKIDTDFSTHFYKNVNPVGMDKFKSILVNNQVLAMASDDFAKSFSNKTENDVKNSLNIRWKLSTNERNKVDKLSKLSQYEIYTLLNVSGRHS